MSEEKREISFQELVSILIEHRKWIVSKGKEGHRANLSNVSIDPKKINMRMAYLCKADLHGINLEWVNLQDAELAWADLHGAYLFRADLRNADLEQVDLHRATIEFADFRNAHLDLSDIHRAYIWWSNFQGATIMGGDLHDSTMTDNDFQNAYLWDTDFRNADLRRCNFENTAVSGVKYNRKGRYNGIRVATCYGSPQFKRFAQDQDFLEELQERSWWGKPLYFIWSALADCGRTPWRWLFWSILLAVWFGLNFFWMGPEAFRLAGDIHDPNNQPLPFSYGTTIYYSVVTFTTLGFGDITPKTPHAAWWVMAEVIVGYIMLGGLISILATLLARRS
jgi:uncharacterized protein YjbI with pentapeptide repeats